MKPRDYQDYAVAEIFRYFIEGNRGNPVVAMPTGTGKSLVIAEFVRRALSQYSGTRIMMVTHVKELIEQNYDKLLKIWPMAPAGIYSAGVGRREAHYPITFAGIASVHNKADLFGKVDLLVVDECHLIPGKSTTMYRKFINFLLKVNPNLKVIGLTATPYRVGMGTITDENGVFDEICCDMTQMDVFNWFFDQGYLCELFPQRTETEIDLTGVGTQQGDFKQGQLQDATDKEYITHAAVKEMVAAAEKENRNHWLVFGTGVDHVNHIVTEINEQGYTAVPVHSKMPAAERDRNIELYLKGEVTALVNMGVLTTGFDAPFTDLIGMLRATKSPGLWVQMLGRGTRPYYAEGYDLTTREGRRAAIANSEKPDCLVMDFAGNTKRLGPINDPVLPKKKGKGSGEAPVRECDDCGLLMHASLRKCPRCGKEFPPAIKFAAKASGEELVAKKKKDDTPIVEVFKVDSLFFSRRKGRMGKPDYLELCYHTGLRKWTQPLCIEHEGYARKKARDWWRKATGEDDGDMVPTTLDEAARRFGECRTPKNIRVWVNKKHPEIMYVDYEGELDEQATKPTGQADGPSIHFRGIPS